MEELNNLKIAVDKLIALRIKIKKAGMPPHTDFWHQSLGDAEQKVKDCFSELGL